MSRNKHARNGVQLRLFLFLSLVLLVAGCGSKGELSGTVSYNGKNLTGGVVTFLPEVGGTSFNAKIGKDGSYHVAKVPAGTMKVGVVSTSSRPSPTPMMAKMLKEMKKKKREYTKEELDKMPPAIRESITSPSDSTNQVPIPAKYNDAEKSGLEYTVIGGAQEYNIELK